MRMFVEIKQWFFSDTAMLFASLLASIGVSLNELIAAIPPMALLLVGIYIKLRKAQQAFRHSEELHNIAKKLLEQGRPVPDYDKPDFE